MSPKKASDPTHLTCNGLAEDCDYRCIVRQLRAGFPSELELRAADLLEDTSINNAGLRNTCHLYRLILAQADRQKEGE